MFNNTHAITALGEEESELNMRALLCHFDVTTGKTDCEFLLCAQKGQPYVGRRVVNAMH